MIYDEQLRQLNRFERKDPNLRGSTIFYKKNRIIEMVE